MKTVALIYAFAAVRLVGSHPLQNNSFTGVEQPGNLNARTNYTTSLPTIPVPTTNQTTSPALYTSFFVGVPNDGVWYEHGNPKCYARVSRVHDHKKGLIGWRGRRHTFTFWCFGDDCHGWKKEDEHFGDYGSLWNNPADDAKACNAWSEDINIRRSKRWNEWVIDVTERNGLIGDEAVSCMEARFIKKLSFHLCNDKSQTSWWLDTVPANDRWPGKYPRCGNGGCDGAR